MITLPLDTLKALLQAAAKKDTRYYLVGILVDRRENDCTLVATNGHMLLAVPHSPPEGGTLALPVGQYIIPRELVETVKAPPSGMVTITIDAAAQTVTIEGASTVTGKLIDGKYPDWRRVVPASADNVPTQYDPTYLAAFHKAALLLGAPKHGAIPFVTFHNGGKAATITFPRHDARGVLMPMRHNSDGILPVFEDVPAWAKH